MAASLQHLASVVEENGNIGKFATRVPRPRPAQNNQPATTTATATARPALPYTFAQRAAPACLTIALAQRAQRGQDRPSAVCIKSIYINQYNYK